MTTTISQDEIHHFDSMADNWWSPKGPHSILHAMNPCRIRYIKEQVLKNSPPTNDLKPFQGLKVLDVGCGGGILCEPMARLGATVTGVDASQKSIDVAIQHAQQNNLDIQYICTSIEEMSDEKFDIVLALEIIEHVENCDIFLKNCARLLKPTGSLFISTLNQTWQSYLGAIIGAEYILRLVPLQTHQWQKFVTPSDLNSYLEKNGLHFVDLKGMNYSVLHRTWSLTKNLSINYIGSVRFLKNASN